MEIRLKWINLALRSIMEFGIVIAFGYWGYHTGIQTGSKILLSICAPLLGFGFWGMVDFHQFGRFGEPLRFIQEMIICAVAVVALYVTGQLVLAIILGLISIIHHVLVYVLGGTLLKSKG